MLFGTKSVLWNFISEYSQGHLYAYNGWINQAKSPSLPLWAPGHAETSMLGARIDNSTSLLLCYPAFCLTYPSAQLCFCGAQWWWLRFVTWGGDGRVNGEGWRVVEGQLVGSWYHCALWAHPELAIHWEPFWKLCVVLSNRKHDLQMSSWAP